MKRIFASLGCLYLVAGFACATAWAQATAQISGTARDQSSAVLPGVEVTVTQADTGITRSVVTNETGYYVLPNLPLGPYRLEAALPGFRTYIQTGIVLQVNSSPAINVVLAVGQVSENVEVQANAALVETRSSTVGSVIENARILDLPLNGRNVLDLITLAGGAVNVAEGRGAGVVGASSPKMSVAGGIGFAVDYTLDGASHVSFETGSTLVMPFPDAMQEFKVETSGASAQHGDSSSVAAVTKSGTNEFHGNLFEFVRNDLFNARSYFATKHGTLKRNQFGGTIGGPIAQNKLFFFGGYQGTTLRSDPADIRAFIPTQAMMAGDWTAFTSPACNAGRQITLRAPFVNNRIDPALYSKPALFVVNWKKTPTPFPTTNDPCGQITYGNLSTNNEGIYVGKVDYQKSAAHSLFGRVLIETNNDLNPSSFNTSILQSSGWRGSMQGSYTLGSTYLINANTVHAFRLAVDRTTNTFHNLKPGERFNWCDTGAKVYCGPDIATVESTSINGGFPLTGNHQEGFAYIGTSYSVNDDLNLVRGAHQMAFGVGATDGREVSLTIWGSTNQFSFNGSATGLGLADFMLGKPSQLFTGRTYPHYANSRFIGAYATDSWKATSKVTLNYGIRWEPFFPQNAEAIYNFDHDRFMQGIKSTVFLNAPAGFYYRGDPGFPKNGVNARWFHLAPRLGLAWDVSGDGRTSVRASYALAYIKIPGEFREWWSGTPPWGGTVNIVSPSGGLEDPWRDVPGGNIFPYNVDKNAPFPPSGQFYSTPYNLKTPYNQTWNLSIQRQIGTDWLASATYTGSNVMHAWLSTPLNPAQYIPGGPCTLNGITYNPCSSLANTDARRKLSLERPADGAKLGDVIGADDGGTQFYHGLLLSAQRRATKGVTVGTNYAWSRCIGSAGTLYSEMAHPNDTLSNAYNRNADRGNCDSDRRQVLNVTTVAETPEFSNQTVRTLATGWRFSGIYRRASGSPLTIVPGSDRALNGLTRQRASQVLGNGYGDSSAPLSSYLNPAAFALPDLGTSGNIGRNSVQGPTTWAFDVAASRIFQVHEGQKVEARIEAFNITNSFRAGNPNVTLSNNTFGVIRTSLDPRILQFALKYVF